MQGIEVPLYLIVAKFKPWRLGSRKVFRCESQVPSPTNIVGEVYVLLPGGASCGEGDMVSGTANPKLQGYVDC